MDNKNPSQFEPNGYMDRLLDLRKKDPARYRTLDPSVVKILEEYEEEKKAANQKLTAHVQGE